MSTVKSWPLSERPRERLLEAGAGPCHLSDAELLAIIIRSGIKGKDALALSREILQSSGGLRGRFGHSSGKHRQIKGLGSAKIAELLDVRQLITRYLKEESLEKNVSRDPQSVLDYPGGSFSRNH